MHVKLISLLSLLYMNTAARQSSLGSQNALIVRTTPCSTVVSVESYEVLNYLGNVTFSSPLAFNGQWHMEITTADPFTFLGGWGVIVKSDAVNKHADLFSAKRVQLRVGDTITFRFRMLYGRYTPIPYINSIRWEGRQICGSSSESLKPRNMSGTQNSEKFTLTNTIKNIEDNSVRRHGRRQVRGIMRLN